MRSINDVVADARNRSEKFDWSIEQIERGAATWSRHRSGGLAAEMAFFAMLSVFPTLLAVAAALGSLEVIVGSGAADRIQTLVVAYLENILTERAAGGIEAVRLMFEQQNDSLFTLAVLGAVATLSRSMRVAMSAMAAIYEVPETRPWWATRLISLGLAAGTIVALSVTLALFVLGPLFGLGVAIGEAVGAGQAVVTGWEYLRGPFAFAILVVFALILFRFAPARRFGMRQDIPGALTAALLWLITSFGLRSYIQIASAGNGIYAALGGALIVLIWFYLLSISLVLGAELNAVLSRRRLRVQGEQVDLQQS